MTSDSRQTMQEKIRLTVDEETERVLDRILDCIEERFEQIDIFKQSLEEMINQIKNLDDVPNKLLEYRNSIVNKIESLNLRSEFSGITNKLDTDRIEFANTFSKSANEFKTFREELTHHQESIKNVEEAISVLVEASANHNKNTEDKLKSNGDLVSNVQIKLNELDRSTNCMNDDIQEKLKKFEEEQNDLKSIFSELSDKLTLMKSILDFIALPWWKRIFGRNK